MMIGRRLKGKENNDHNLTMPTLSITSVTAAEPNELTLRKLTSDGRRCYIASRPGVA